MWQLPQTLAAIHEEKLIDVLNVEIPAARIPMEMFLTHGGWPEAASFQLRGKRELADAWEILLTLEFTELCPAACPASHRPERRQGYLILKVHKSDGSAQFFID